MTTTKKKRQFPKDGTRTLLARIQPKFFTKAVKFKKLKHQTWPQFVEKMIASHCR